MTALLLSLVAFFGACTTKTEKVEKLGEGLYAQIETNKGTIVVALEFEKTPITVANFVSLAEGKNKYVDKKYTGKKYYDGSPFHRVINDFMIQTGDPEGLPDGNPGYRFKDEIVPELKHDKAGILSMANAGPGTNGSQFFITHKPTEWLDGRHTVFGHVVQGIDIVNSIVQGDKMNKITILRNGAKAKKFKAEKVFEEYYENYAKEQKKMEEASQKVRADKAAEFAKAKAEGTKTQSGLIYKVVTQGTGVKPAAGTNVNIHYAGYFEDGNLFDTSVPDVAKAYGKLDEQRLKYNQYQPLPFKYGNKQGMIPGFIEGIENMNMGDKVIVIIPPHLGYGAAGAGGVIPPNATLIFEMEMLP